MLDGYDDAFNQKKQEYLDKDYNWEYRNNSGLFSKAVKTYTNIDYSPKENSGFAFRTAESFLSNLNKKTEISVDLSKYKTGVTVYHKKFGEGVITEVEQEDDDLKVDIEFEKFGHKRLMAKFANLEVIG